MNSTINLYKKIIIGITVIVTALLIILTIDTVTETGDWELFDIDFKTYNDIASAYGTLIGGILAFLSILFVFFSILEQREQVINEKADKVREEEEDLLDRLRLLNSFLSSVTDDIISQGKRIKAFYELEQAAPSTMNTMYFNTNKNFGRLVDIDTLTLFKGYQLYFRENPKWDKMFLNTFNLIDFYSEALRELREKYQNHINDKVKQQKQIGYDLHKMVNLLTRILTIYLVNTNAGIYLNFSWCKWANNFIPIYHIYLEECAAKQEMPDFRHISDKLLAPFLNEAMQIRAEYGFDSYSMGEVIEIIELASDLRKKIQEVEVYCLQYAGNLEYYYNKYFSQDNDSVKDLKKIQQEIESVLKKANEQKS